MSRQHNPAADHDEEVCGTHGSHLQYYSSSLSWHAVFEPGKQVPVYVAEMFGTNKLDRGHGLTCVS